MHVFFKLLNYVFLTLPSFHVRFFIHLRVYAAHRRVSSEDLVLIGEDF